MARRVTQVPVQVPLTTTGVGVNRRLTQLPVEVLNQATGASVNRRITQIAEEILNQALGPSLNRRVTQIVIEVMELQPAMAFAPAGDPPIEQTWDPATYYPAEVDPGAHLGIGLRILMIKELGARGRSVVIPRR